MKQRIQTVGWLTALLALTLLWVSPAMAKEYDLWIADTQVTDKNCSNLYLIKGVTAADGGEFHYDPSTNTLTMKDVTVDVKTYCAIECNIKGLKIVVSGENILKARSAALYIHASTFIDGDGSLYCYGDYVIQSENYVFSEKIPLSISNIYFNMIRGSIRGDIRFGGKLTLKNVKGYIDGRIEHMTDFTTEDCGIIEPEDGYFDKKKRAVVDADGNVAKGVWIGKLVFPLYIAGE